MHTEISCRNVSFGRRVGAAAATLFLGAAVALAPTLAQAQDWVPDPVPNTRNPLLPYRGMYYDISKSGVGLTVDVDSNGVVFAMFYAYTEDGDPTFYNIQGMFDATSEKERIKTGVIGTLDTQAYISENGQCVGDGCAYKAPDRTMVPIYAHLVWTAPRQVTVQIGSQTWHMRGGQLSVSYEDVLVGQWVVTSWAYGIAYGRLSAGYKTEMCEVSRYHGLLTPADFPVLRDDDGYVVQGVAIPHGARLFWLECDGLEYDPNATFIWFDPSTRAMGLFEADLGPQLSAPESARDVQVRTNDLYLDGTMTLRARNDDGGQSESNGGMVWTRLPDGRTWEAPPEY